MFHAHPFFADIFGGWVHGLKVGLGHDQARANGVDIDTVLLALFRKSIRKSIYTCFGTIVSDHHRTGALHTACSTEIENFAAALVFHHRPDRTSTQKG